MTEGAKIDRMGKVKAGRGEREERYYVHVDPPR